LRPSAARASRRDGDRTLRDRAITASPGAPSASFDSPLEIIEPAGFRELAHFLFGEARKTEGDCARTDRGEQIVRIPRGHDDDQVRRRLLEGFQSEFAACSFRPIDLIDEKYAPRAFERLEGGAFFQEPHLRNGDLPQRTVGCEGDEIGMRGKNNGSSLRLSDVHFSRSVISAAFDSRLRSSSWMRPAGSPRSRSPKRRASVAFPTPSATRKEQCLGDAITRDHLLQNVGDRAISEKFCKISTLSRSTVSPCTNVFSLRE